MDKKEAYRILTDDNQNIIDSMYPFCVNKKWLEAYHIAVDSLKENEKLKADNYELNNRINDMLDDISARDLKKILKNYKNKEIDYAPELYKELSQLLEGKI